MADNSKHVDDFNNFLKISATPGFKVFTAEIERQIAVYEAMMENDAASGDLLKNYQLIKKGLKLALAIPNTLESRAMAELKKKGR